MKKVWEIYFKLMFITIFIGLMINLFSCKANKNANCDAYSNTLSVPYQDTIVMESISAELRPELCRYRFEEEHACVWVKADTNVYCDTLYLEVYNEVK